jgi:hypothetical protein
MTLDYCLYDNRTSAPRIGREWGLKAATGRLASRRDLLSAFDAYCTLTPGDQAPLARFGAAVGGVRPGGGSQGYLLCVTLEAPDFYGRPSWAIVGLWCPTREILTEVLRDGDPIGAARELTRAGTLPAEVEIRRASSPLLRGRSLPSARLVLRFDPAASASIAMALLLAGSRRERSRGQLPEILGITGSAKLGSAGERFGVVFCHPMDEKTGRALASLPSSRVPAEEEEAPAEAVIDADSRWPPVAVDPSAGDTYGGEGKRPPSRRWRPPRLLPPEGDGEGWEWRFFLSPRFLVWVIVAAAGILAIEEAIRHRSRFFPVAGAPAASSMSPETGEPADPAAEDAGKKGAPSSASSGAAASAASAASAGPWKPEQAMGMLANRLDAVRALDPHALRQSRGFVTVETIDVLSEHAAERQRIRKAYADLLRLQERLPRTYSDTGGETSIAYYLTGDVKNLPVAQRVARLAQLLEPGAFGQGECDVIRETFGAELDTKDSVAGAWCDALGAFADTAKSFRRNAKSMRSTADR